MVLPSVFDLLDIALVAGVLWLVYRSLVRTRARNAVVGLAVLASVYVIARALDLVLMATLLQSFFAVAVLVLIVVFQEDLRRFFEDLGNLRPDRGSANTTDPDIDALVRATARLATTRTGALIVVPGRDALDRHVTGGVALGGRASEPLLLSIFDSSSPGHDGALVLRGGMIERFAVHLPLSANHAAVGPGGTRHAAGLGLSERCDATVIIVSEERGTISVAKGGVLRTLPGAEALLDEFAAPVEAPESVPLHRRRTAWEGAIALAAAALLWAVIVPGSEVVESTITVPISIHNLPEDLALVATDPAEATLVLRGPRRSLLLAERSGLEVTVDAYLAQLGRRTFTLDASAVDGLAGATVTSITPERIRLDLAPVESAPPDASPDGGR